MSKPKKIWLDKGVEFYNISMKSLLQDNDIEMCSTRNKEKSLVGERFIRTSKNKIYKYVTLISKKVYVINLANIVNKYNNTCHNTIKMKPFEVKSSTYIRFNKDNYNKDPKFYVGDHVRISKYKNIFTKVYVPNWSEEIFVIKKIKNTVPWTYISLVILMVKKQLECFTKNNSKKQVKKSLELKK